WVLKYQSSLADVCTMVCWDQRGSGKSYTNAQAQEDMTLEQVVKDAYEVCTYLCEKFGKKKISIVGHSWGSMLGLLLAQAHPEIIDKYIGMGQLINGEINEDISYDFVMNYATKSNDRKAIASLTKIGRPIKGLYRNLDDLVIQRNYMTKYGGGCYAEKESIWKSMILPLLSTPEYTLGDMIRYYKGTFYCLNKLWEQVVTAKFDETIKHLDVSVYITQGRHDKNTPPEISTKWFEQLDAPYKEWIWFENSAHSPIKEEPTRWGEVIKSIIVNNSATTIAK
ncbi:MAG: alpha/beta hydrolase, partial [Clostridia bacterium]